MCVIVRHICELLQNNERNISKSECSSNNDMYVKISSTSKQSVSSDDGHFLFSYKTGLNAHLDDSNNSLEYFEPFIAHEIA
jgi:hypothetical protein